MAVVNTEHQGQIMLIQMNRPERMNALGVELRTELAAAFTEFKDDPDSEVAVFTGTGRAFCAGEDMKESFCHIFSTTSNTSAERSPTPCRSLGSRPYSSRSVGMARVPMPQ